MRLDPRPSTPSTLGTTLLRSGAPAALGLLLGAAITAGCTPTVDNTGCSADADCQGRAEMCDIPNNTCVPIVVDMTSTETPAPMTFTAKAVPFHRGTVCMPHEVKAGADVPITLNPCFHPCLEQGAFKHKHYYSCLGSRCDAWAVMYIEAASVAEGCPADAFGSFDRSLCVAGPPVNLSIGTTIDSGPVNGTMGFEIPFLTNADAQAIAANFDDIPLIQEKIDQYPADDSRIPGGTDIELSPNHPEPPASCETGCECFDIGF